MLKNYLKIALRNVKNQKLYSFLNVFGLALGLTGMLLIYFFVQHELSYDRFHTHADRIHRIIAQQPGNEFMGTDKFVVTPITLGYEMSQALPEVESSTTVRKGPFLIGHEDNYYNEEGIWADSTFFDVFQYTLREGNVQTALTDPGQVVLTASFAKKVFGTTSPMGKVLTAEQWGRRLTVEVAGIMDDVPENTHLSFDFILPLHAEPDYRQHWENRTISSYLTYVLLRESASSEALQEKLPAFEQVYFGEEDAGDYNLEIQPVTSIHLYNDANFDVGTPGSSRFVLLVGGLGFIILLLACINYMNLAVARSVKRAQEVGLRQVIGARRGQIAVQFISESVLLSALALGVALFLVHLLLPTFGELVNRPLGQGWGSQWLLPELVVLVLLVGLLSGSYPALYMSQLRPIQTLKGQLTGSYKKSLLQRSLIVVQYTASVVLLAGSIVIFRQLQFVQNTDVGYEREQVVTFQMTGIDQEAIPTIKQEVRRLPGVSAVVEVSHLPSQVDNSRMADTWEGRESGEAFLVYQMQVGSAFFEVFEIDLVAGQPFSGEIVRDATQRLILNEKAVAAAGWIPEEAIGRSFGDNGIVVGVMQDFHMHSLHLPIAPLVITPNNRWVRHLAVRLGPGDPAGTLAEISGMLDELTGLSCGVCLYGRGLCSPVSF